MDSRKKIKRTNKNKKSYKKQYKKTANKVRSKNKSKEDNKLIQNILEKEVTRREFLKYAAYTGIGIGLGIIGIELLNNLRRNQEQMKITHLSNISNHTNNKPNNMITDTRLKEIIRKYSKEASHYYSFGNNVKCLLCPHGCVLKPGERGICRVRINIDGKLYTLVYGNPAAIHVDPIEKKPLFHFMPGSKAFSIATAGCNLRCLNCQNWQLSQSKPEDLQEYTMYPEQVVELAKRYSCESIAYTYSEPSIFYEYMLDTAKIAKENGIKNVYISAGYINETPLKELSKYMDAANIDLKSFSDEIYRKLNGATLEPVLNTLKILKDAGVWLEITNLIIPNWTDDLGMIEKMVTWLVKNGFENYPLHFSRFHPDYKLKNLPATPVSTLIKAREIAIKRGMKFVYIGNVPGTYEDTYCPNCKKLLVKRYGFKVVFNKIKDGKCPYCNTKIPGVWT